MHVIVQLILPFSSIGATYVMRHHSVPHAPTLTSVGNALIVSPTLTENVYAPQPPISLTQPVSLAISRIVIYARLIMCVPLVLQYQQKSMECV